MSRAEEQLEVEARHRAHLASGLRDEALLARYSRQPDLVAFVDETHRSTPSGDKGYYGISAVVFHAEELPQIRQDLTEIAGGPYWHSKDAFKDARQRPKIAEMNQYIADRAAMPAIVFEVRNYEVTDRNERGLRDICLDRALRELDSEQIRDVVLDDFPRTMGHQRKMDEAVLTRLRARELVDEGMWMRHARMGDEAALWSADTVAWSAQRHAFGTQLRDSAHLAPLRGKLREIHAETGRQRMLTAPSPLRTIGPSGRTERPAPIYSMANQVEAARRTAKAPPARPRSATFPETPKAPPTQGPEGPSRSL